MRHRGVSEDHEDRPPIRRAVVPLVVVPAANADSRTLAPRTSVSGSRGARGEPSARRKRSFSEQSGSRTDPHRLAIRHQKLLDAVAVDVADRRGERRTVVHGPG